MKIGIDIDDTISNSFESIFEDSQKYDIQELGRDGSVKKYGKVENHHYIETMYDWTEEQVAEFWNRYFINMLTVATPKDSANEILYKLQQENNEIILITSRYEMEKFPYVEFHTRNWLERNKIPYDKLIMNAQDKLVAAQNEQIDVMIDDSITHCKHLQEGKIQVLLFTSKMNQSIDVPDLERVYSWRQVYNKLKK